MRPFVDLLLEMTLLNDSWQKHRVVNILKGELKTDEGRQSAYSYAISKWKL